MELDVKRLYVPGTVLQDNCPKCKKLVVHDLADYYLSYPTVNEPENWGFWCGEDDGCGHEWTREILVTFKVEMLPKGAE